MNTVTISLEEYKRMERLLENLREENDALKANTSYINNDYQQIVVGDNLVLQELKQYNSDLYSENQRNLQNFNKYRRKVENLPRRIQRKYNLYGL